MVKFPSYQVGLLSSDSNLELESKPWVKFCQEQTEPAVKFFPMSNFGDRLKIAFNNARNAEIARKMGVSEPAVKKYLSGSLPNIENLILIKTLTGRSLDWLIQGENETAGEELKISSELRERLRTYAREQADIAFGDAQIAGDNIEEKTFELLVSYLIARALRSVNLIESEAELMSASDFKRAQRFTFNANLPQSIDDRINEIVEKKLAGNDVSQVAQRDAFRDMIRELVQEEISKGKQRPFIEIDFGHGSEEEQKIPRRKAG